MVLFGSRGVEKRHICSSLFSYDLLQQTLLHSPFFVFADRGKSSNVFTCLANVSKFERCC